MKRKGLIRILPLCVLLLVINTLVVLVVSRSGEDGGIYSLSCRMFFVLIYGMVLIEIYRNKGLIRDASSFGLILFMFGSAAVSYFANPIGSTSEWLIITMSYLEIPVLYMVTQSSLLDMNTINSKLIRVLILLIGVDLSISGLVNPVYEQYHGALTMGYTNANRTAMYLLIVICLCTAFEKVSERRFLRVLYILCSAVMTFLVPLTQSRSGLVCVILVWIFWFFGDKIIKVLRPIHIIIILILPLLFSVIYLVLIDRSNPFIINTIVYGKSLASGRQYIYKSCFEALKGKWIFGNYAFSPLANKHNTLITVLTSFGIVGLVAFLLFYGKMFMSYFRIAKLNMNASYPFFCLIVIYIGGMTEAAFFTSGIMYAGLVGLVMMLLIAESREDLAIPNSNEEFKPYD